MDKFLPIRKMREQDKDCKVPTNLVPRCPRCHEVLEVNLRKDDTFVEDAHWHIQNERYEQFLNHFLHHCSHNQSLDYMNNLMNN